MPTAKAAPGKLLLTPQDHTLIMIDFQSQMAFATKSIDAVQLRNNAALVAHAAAGFGASTILTTVAEKSFSGPMFEEIGRAFPGQKMLDRTSMNTWEDAGVIARVNEIGKGRIVLAGLWTSVCIVGPALSRVPGVAQVQTFGEQLYSVRVRLDPDRIASMGLGFDQVQQAA